MKALTNILNYILLLMMILIASCTEDTAEVDDLVRGEEYVQVRMQVPGMKAANTRATADDNITSIVALVFREDKLISKTEVTNLTTITSTTGTFNLPRPKSGDVIHFLANLPEGYDLSSVDEMSDLTSLTTDNPSQLSYWGMATYNGGDVIDNVMLYRNMAKVEIVAGPDCTFPEDQLFIAGLMKPNGKGTLVPYKNGFNFDLDYYTLPTELPTRFNNEFPTPVTSVYLFEHDNPGTADGLFIICLIGKDYYRVALIDDETGQPYDIIRNHRYVIYVDDLDEGADRFDDATEDDPINFDVIEYKDVTLTITPSATSLNYDDNETSAEQVTVTVGGLQDVVETLTFTAPGYTILSDYAKSAGEGVFTITDTSKTEIDFTFTLTDQSQAGEISVTGEGDLVSSINTAETFIQWNKRQEVNGEIVMWEGSVKMHNNTADGTTHAGKVLIPYSFFFDANGTQKIPVNSKISLEYDKNGTGYIQTNLFKDGEPSIWDISDDGTELTLTQELLTKIKDNHKEVWDVDAAFVFEGGGGAVLNKVTLIPAKESITANITNGETLYYDSDDAQVVTVNVTIPDGVETLNILAEDFIFDEDSDGNYTYAVNSQTSATLSFTLKSGLSARTSTITFSDASGNATEDAVNVNLVETPVVTFEYSDNPMLYWNNGSPTNFQVQMTGNNVPNDKTITLTITAPDFTVTAQNGTLTQNGDVWTYTGTLTTLTFTPTSSGDDKPINITGEGENVNVKEANISVDVDATLLAVTPIATTINMDNSETSTILTLTKPGNITNLKVTASNNNAFTINGNEINGDYYIGGLSSNNATIDYTIALRDGFNTAGEYTITFTDNGGGGQSVTATITVKNTPSLQFEYEDNTILYLDGGDGSPTTLPVTITVPEGSSLTQLNITATGFTVTASSEGLSGSEGSYTYTGGSTTFTFVPTNTTATTIKFTGTGTNLKAINETIIVEVKETKPVGGTEIVLWDTETVMNWNDVKFTDKRIGQNVGGKLRIDIVAKSGAQVQLYYPNYQSISGFEEGEERTFEFIIESATNNDIRINGINFTLKKVYIVPASQ